MASSSNEPAGIPLREQPPATLHAAAMAAEPHNNAGINSRAVVDVYKSDFHLWQGDTYRRANLRIASPRGDRYRFLEDPASVISGLRASGLRIDLSTFAQKLPESVPKFSYSFEWDNFAVLPVTTFLQRCASMLAPGGIMVVRLCTGTNREDKLARTVEAVVRQRFSVIERQCTQEPPSLSLVFRPLRQ